MKIVVAPDSFKECLSSREVAACLGDAVRSDLPGCNVLELPLADGGEGTVDVLTAALGGRIVPVRVSDPLGRPVTAVFGMAGETAVIEVAQACGLGLLAPQERNPLRTGTRGVGEMLMAAREAGCRRFIVGLGGSSTCDGGSGMMSVPGIREALDGAFFEILCDVDAPFTGPAGAAHVFGPQKGASAADVEVLERRMLGQAVRILADTGTDVSSATGAGAAGGLGGAFLAYFYATLQSGIDRVLDLVGFDAAVSDAQLVITGEGRSDLQTLSGKAAFGVLRRSRRGASVAPAFGLQQPAAMACPGQQSLPGAVVPGVPRPNGGVPVALLSGRVEDRDVLLQAGFSSVLEVSPRGLPLQQALQPDIARTNLTAAASRLLRQLGSLPR